MANFEENVSKVERMTCRSTPQADGDTNDGLIEDPDLLGHNSDDIQPCFSWT